MAGADMTRERELTKAQGAPGEPGAPRLWTIRQYNVRLPGWASFPAVPDPIPITLEITKDAVLMAARFDPPGSGWQTFSLYVWMDAARAAETISLLVALPGHEVPDDYRFFGRIASPQMVAFLFHK